MRSTPELGVSDKGDIQNVQGMGACRTGLKTTAVRGRVRVDVNKTQSNRYTIIFIVHFRSELYPF